MSCILSWIAGMLFSEAAKKRRFADYARKEKSNLQMEEERRGKKMEKRSFVKKEITVTGMQRLTKGSLILFAILFGVGGSILVSFLFGKQLKEALPNYFVLRFVSELISAILGLLLVFAFRKQKVLKASVTGMKEGLACGMAWILLPILVIARLVMDLRDIPDLQFIQGWEILLLLLQCILIGFFEECVFRGIALELSFELFGAGTKKQAKRAILVVSFLFGATHLINAFHPEITLAAASMQALSAMGLGLVFGAIYFRSERNIWPCVIFHAIQDASAFIANGALYGVSQETAIGKTSVSQVFYSLLFVAWFFFLMREQTDEK